MASHRRPRKPGRPAKVAVGAATAAVSSVVMLPTVGEASPKPGIKEVQRQVDDLYKQVDKTAQEYGGAQQRLKELQKQADQTQAEIDTEHKNYLELRDTADTIASAQYRAGGIDPTWNMILSESPETFLQRASVLNQVSTQQVDKVRQVEEKQRELDRHHKHVAQQLADVERTRTNLLAQKNKIESALKKAEELLDGLEDEDRAQVESAESSAREKNDKTLVNLGLKKASSRTAATGRAAAAIAFARSQVGKPYVWGASGPNAFDCSGLTQAAYRAAGIKLPRTTYEQIKAGKRISTSELRPGDLVFYYSGVSHVGMYIGNGQIVHAPNPRSTVKVSPVKSMPIAGAVRPA